MGLVAVKVSWCRFKYYLLSKIIIVEYSLDKNKNLIFFIVDTQLNHLICDLHIIHILK